MNLLAGVSAVFWLAVNGDGFLNWTDIVLPVDVDTSSGIARFFRLDMKKSYVFLTIKFKLFSFEKLINRFNGWQLWDIMYYAKTWWWNIPCLLRNLSNGLPTSADDGTDHLGLDEDPEREVDRSLKED